MNSLLAKATSHELFQAAAQQLLTEIATLGLSGVYDKVMDTLAAKIVEELNKEQKEEKHDIPELRCISQFDQESE